MYNFNDYDTISDTIDWLNSTTMYRFYTKLSRKTKENKRNSFHKEFTYKSSYIDKREAVSIKREFDYYLSIENIGKTIFVQIRPHNILFMRSILTEFFNNKLNNNKYWDVIDNKLVIKSKPKTVYIEGLPMDKTLGLDIISIPYQNGMYSKGVRITVNNDEFIDVDIERFAGFLYTIMQIDMYAIACHHLNYIQRPEFGTNMMVIDNAPANIPDEIQEPNKPINKNRRKFDATISLEDF